MKCKRRRGQSLVEILVALAVGGTLLAVGVGLLNVALRENAQVTQIQAKAALASGLLTNVRSWASADWNNVLSVATGSANHYYLDTSNSPFTAVYAPTGGVTEGLVGFWPLNEGTGSTTIDGSGNGNKGTWTGVPVGNNGTYYTTGNNQTYAGSFNGATSSWNSAITDSMSEGGNFPTGSSPRSVFAWIYPKSFGGGAYGFDIIEGWGGWWSDSVLYENGNLLAWSDFLGGGSEGSGMMPFVSNLTLATNTWQFVGYTYNGGTASSVTLYVNGQSQTGSVPYPANTGSGSGGIGDLIIFDNFINWPCPFQGSIEDVAVYNRVLSATEITTLYQANKVQ